MKSRQGFVSNSSTTSFLIYGASMSERGEERAAVEEKARELGLDVEYGYEGENAYIGLSWDKVGVDETGGQFMKKIEDKVKAILGPDAKCGTHQEAWYDG